MKVFIFSALTLFGSFGWAGKTVPKPCTPWSYTYDCSYCAQYCNSCNYTTVSDPAYTNIVLNQLPIQFNYSHADTTQNCYHGCGPSSCSGGTTFDANRTLPASWQTGACSANPNDKLPSTINCSYRHGYCGSYCANYVSRTCTVSGCS